jgi:nucleotide-binding universal stress UspA family protein
MAERSTVLVATDLSEPAVNALKKGVEVAQRLGAELIVTFVVDDRLPPMVLAHTSDPVELLERHRQHATKALDEHIAQHLAGRPVEALVRVGTAHQQIVKLAQERQVEMIILGMHGHGYLAHALAGSTAERVLHHAPCPVLVVPYE